MNSITLVTVHGVGIFIDLGGQEFGIFITNSRFYNMSHAVIYLKDICSSTKVSVVYKLLLEYNNYINIYTFRAMIVTKLSGYNTLF